MIGKANGRRRMGGMAAWLALLTALVCSLVPLGPAVGRGAGSAFDPTTSAVTVSPRASAAERAAEREAPKQPRAATPAGPPRAWHVQIGASQSLLWPTIATLPEARPAYRPAALPGRQLPLRGVPAARAPPAA